jgi:hypothetical protein
MFLNAIIAVRFVLSCRSVLRLLYINYKLHFCDTTPCSPFEVNQCFGGTCRLHPQVRRISRARNKRESKWQAEQSEMENKSVLVGSPVAQNEPPAPIGSHTQPSEPIGDENRIASLALNRAVCAGLGKYRGEVVRGVVGRESSSRAQNSCAWILRTGFRIREQG